ncbi:hypothetical protein HIM_03713 [Hirsutella minnesotensis 3608]|uniref:Glycosyltransferase family 25 protein n=1 Tax=Hirsutella minnesotensis 3608 TaxID=1043627 RepID=A0A0F7ZM03_9HYPO|nr:hypothetical protein HIM_03713 [Hirsutella minnesotensis 3608]
MIQAGFPKRVVGAFGAALFLLTVLMFFKGPSKVAIGRRWSENYSILNEINNATLGFEKLLVVGLPSRTDRRDGMILQAALSDMEIGFVDGVTEPQVEEKAIPKIENADHIHGPNLGSWRGHMNAIQQVVWQNLSSALIFEDDIDWDIRLRQQLRDFALSAHALTQPLRTSADRFADPTYPGDPNGDAPPVTVADFSFDKLPQTFAPTKSPYGDDWDVLWIGHCGMHFPFQDNAIPKGRVIHLNDNTVPEREHLWTLNVPFTLKEQYPEHTRAIHHVQEGVCSLGYAVSRSGARKLLRHLGLREPTDPFDILLRFFCEGVQGMPQQPRCLTIQPSLFHHHRPVGPNKEASDIGNHGDGFRTKAQTDMVRWSVRLNAEALLNGTANYTDQYPDTQ